jgi:hypothetical protein
MDHRVILITATLAFVGSSAYSQEAPSVPSAPQSAQTQPERRDHAQPDLPPVPEIESRLAELDGSDAKAYFLLAEEVADEARTAQHVRLARQLYVLAYEIEREAGGQRPLAPSICLGLRAIERVDDTRAWLAAMAGALDSRYEEPDWATSPDAGATEAGAFKTATMLGMARSGEGSHALSLRDDPEVRQTLNRYASMLGAAAVNAIDSMIRTWPCPECGNDRSVRRRTSQGIETRLCNTCLGNPGPKLSIEEYIAQLRFESRLLRGVQRSWSAQLAMDRGAPLLDADPDGLTRALAARYGLQTERRLWRDGAWVRGPLGP